MSIDAVLTKTNNVYDFNITDEGDIEMENFFDTAILMSIFCERRATASEMPESHRRRGWIGNEQGDGFEIGSKIWLYEQERITGTTLASMRKQILNALQWLIDDGYAVAIEASVTLKNGVVTAETTIERPNSKVDKRFHELWQNTGVR